MKKSFDPIVVANTLWVTAHGISSLLIDGQVPAENAFQKFPALLKKQKGAVSPDIRQIFEAISQIIFTGLLND